MKPALLSHSWGLVVYVCGSVQPHEHSMQLVQRNKPSSDLSAFTILVLNCFQRPNFFSTYPLTPDLPRVWPRNSFYFLWYHHVHRTWPSEPHLPSSAVIRIVPSGRFCLIILGEQHTQFGLVVRPSLFA